MGKLKDIYDLPMCLGYKSPEVDCPTINSDDWDELEDSCQNCGWWKPNYVHFHRDICGEEIDADKIRSKMR